LSLDRKIHRAYFGVVCGKGGNMTENAILFEIMVIEINLYVIEKRILLNLMQIHLQRKKINLSVEVFTCGDERQQREERRMQGGRL
jgi:hypothetical protein